MAEKKETKVVTTKAVTTAKKTTVRKATIKKTVSVDVSAENVGFRAGDVYQTLSVAGTALSIGDIAKVTNKTEAEVLLGIGWLLKEGKIKGENDIVTLA